MASTVEIANQALYNLGQNAIVSMTEDSTAARLCNGRFTYVRDSVVRAYPWNCAIRRAELAQSSDTPAWEYDYQYQLPTSPYCLRVLTMEEQIDEGYKYVIEGRYILTDADTCNIKYIAQLTDANDMDILLRETIAARLAAEIAFPLTGQKNIADAMWNLYERKLREARSIDAQEGTPETIMEDTFLDSRL
ncbi:MAG: hypothetical protein PHT59_07455 [Candidatus Omnitrophica bacterium]|nr:hypothetical protein [Candidatus Omnitrophota bacterium]